MSQSKPLHGRARLVLFIAKEGDETLTPYVVKLVSTDGKVADHPAISLTKDDGTVYHLHRNQWGFHCDCPQFNFRSSKDGKACKHCKAVQAALLPVLAALGD